ncbi:uncharacterized protein LOC110346650 [Heterocephalus glaber]|uniref:Uncharacterized protein LOC110346650 n=1 Tax=Heterocephalus glaber TaxID=10181 RepID=A0AAX6S817_HETGA|nr:uncharacterized protein LOC110346650 [Heterocephalus glaber]XP_021103796.1 uncharacterized protein LOC110346650 [Heterocephalus glaber]
MAIISSLWEAEAGGSRGGAQPGQFSNLVRPCLKIKNKMGSVKAPRSIPFKTKKTKDANVRKPDLVERGPSCTAGGLDAPRPLPLASWSGLGNNPALPAVQRPAGPRPGFSQGCAKGKEKVTARFVTPGPGRRCEAGSPETFARAAPSCTAPTAEQPVPQLAFVNPAPRCGLGLRPRPGTGSPRLFTNSSRPATREAGLEPCPLRELTCQEFSFLCLPGQVLPILVQPSELPDPESGPRSPGRESAPSRAPPGPFRSPGGLVQAGAGQGEGREGPASTQPPPLESPTKTDPVGSKLLLQEIYACAG